MWFYYKVKYRLASIAVVLIILTRLTKLRVEFILVLVVLLALAPDEYAGCSKNIEF